jgi:hypothetical protein
MKVSKEAIKAIIVRSIALVAFLSISYWLLCPSGFIAQLLKVDISFLFLPILISSIVFYLSAVVNAIYASKVMGIANSALRGLAIALAMYLIAMQWAFGIWTSIIFWVFIIALTAIFDHVVNSLANLYNEPLLSILSTAISLFLVGLSFSKIMASFLSYPPSPLKAFPDVVFWTFTIVAAISLLSIFKYFSNPYLRVLGTKVGSNVVGMTALMFLVLMYFFALRPQIIGYPIPIPISLIEWGIICLSIWLFYRSLKGQVNSYLTEPLEMGDWAKLVQEIEHRIDPEQVSLADLIREFIDCGVKDGVITRLVAIMLLNGLSEESIRKIVRKILEYQDLPYPRIRLTQWVKGIDEENKRRRKNLLKMLLDEIEQEMRSAELHRLFKAGQVEVKMEGREIGSL